MKQSVSSRIVTHRFHLKSWFLHRIRSCQDYSMEDWLRNDAEKDTRVPSNVSETVEAKSLPWLTSIVLLCTGLHDLFYNWVQSIVINCNHCLVAVLVWVKDTVFSNRINTNLERKHNRLVNLTLQWPTHKCFFIKLTLLVSLGLTFHLKKQNLSMVIIGTPFFTLVAWSSGPDPSAKVSGNPKFESHLG